MKLLVVASSLDLRAPLGVTPSTWQLLKALAECGTELTVAPYQGPPIESPWWTAAANPCQFEGDVVAHLKSLLPARTARAGPRGESISDRLARALVARVTMPRWRRHLEHLIESERDFDALLLLSVPPNHFRGIPRLLERRYGLPTFLFDGDVPASLPRFEGFRTGFRIYAGADLSEFAGMLCNSLAGRDDLLAMGARDVRVLHYFADPTLFSPRDREQDIDVFFYGLGREYREDWLEAMLDVPSRSMAGARFAVRGHGLGELPAVERLPFASLSRLQAYCSRSRINLLITRRAHASVYGSSTARPFELAALGCAIVSNPYLGIAEWFEPGREVLIVNSADEAIATYRHLLRDPATRRELGAAARKRLIDEHTPVHRARALLAALSGHQVVAPAR